MKTMWCLLAVAFALWFFMFSPWTRGLVSFWTVMSASAFILGSCSLVACRKDKSLFKFKAEYIGAGLISAGILYLIFLAGGFAVKLFSFADEGVRNIYAIRGESPMVVIGIAIFFLIGPAEEFFWRGLVQYRLGKRYGDTAGLLAGSFLYAAAHIWSFNFMLVLTAAVCGFFWGYIFNRYKSVWPVVISHAVWDLVIFVLLPVTKFTG